MSSSTKVLLALIALLVGVLVAYYGFLMAGPDVGVGTAATSGSGKSGSDADDESNAATRTGGTPTERRGPGRDVADLVPRMTVSPAETDPPAPMETNGSRRADGPSELRPSGNVPGGRGVTQPAVATREDRLKTVAQLPPSEVAPEPEPVAPPPTGNAGDGSAAGESTGVRPNGTTRPAGRERPGAVTANGRGRIDPPANGGSRVGEPGSWVVAEGDTLSEIAEAWFGRSADWRRIVAANPGIDPARLRIDQKLVLPRRTAGTTNGAADSGDAAGTRARRGGSTHIVAKGETLTAIAQKHYGTAAYWEHLYAANRRTIGGDPDDLRVGMRLVVPARP